jgi:hypothetical protein
MKSTFQQKNAHIKDNGEEIGKKDMVKQLTRMALIIMATG